MSIISHNSLSVPSQDRSRATFLPFAKPDLDDAELNEIRDTLHSGWVTTGPKTRRFQSEFADYLGVKHAIAVNSCTAALHLALEAIGVERGDEVITSPYTFAATAEVIRYFDAHPVFVDVTESSLNIDSELLENAITGRTKAIIPIHLAGLPADCERISEIAKRHSLPIIEDAAHAFPSKYKGRMIGSIGDVTCFSFYATKTMTTGEGGMICTNDDDIAARCRITASHGITKDAWQRYGEEGSWYYEIVAPGYKYNLTDIAAALGVAQLRKAERMWRRRREIAMTYNAVFSSFSELECPGDRSDSQHAWHLYMLRLNQRHLTINREQFVKELAKRNIGVSVHFIPLHLHPYYRDKYGYVPERFPVALREFQREVSLPIYSRMADEDVHDVVDAVVDIVDTYRI